jgi:Mrp family chromosome partitioning ATPase
VTDPVILSQIAGGVIMIIRAGETARNIARRARDQLLDVKAHILGGVLNSVDLQKDNYYYYSYYYNYYYQEKEEGRERNTRKTAPYGDKIAWTKLFRKHKKIPSNVT